MTATLTFFPVGNGDMALVSLNDANETKILVDVNIRAAADDKDDKTARDVAADLRRALKRDAKKRPYVDVFLLSHPDKDHCSGLEKHFYLGKPEDYPDDDKKDHEKRILIREIWSSPIVFRRASTQHPLCADAKAFNTEAKRRVKVARDKNFAGVTEGDRILIMGEDKDGKTDDLGPILVKVDQTFDRVNGTKSEFFRARLLAPLPVSDDETEDLLSKNHSSVVLNMSIAASNGSFDDCKFLTGGDAEVAIWDRLWEKYKNTPEALAYDLMETPHHCSWHTLSSDSRSKLGGNAKVSPAARSALSQIRAGGIIVASCDPIKNDDNDPPCYAAKQEYVSITNSASGQFFCTSEYPGVDAPEPLIFTITKDGLQPPAKKESAAKSAAIISAAREPISHG